MHGNGQAAVGRGLLKVAVLLAVISTGTEVAWLSCYRTCSRKLLKRQLCAQVHRCTAAAWLVATFAGSYLC
jgi:hypothetical protein